jgi:integrase
MKKRYSKADRDELLSRLSYIDQFLDRYSTGGSRRLIEGRLLHFTEFLRDRFQITPIEAKFDHVLTFLKEDIDKRDILVDSKNNWRSTLNIYYSFIKEIKRMQDESYLNPVPASLIFEFSEKELTTADIEQKHDYIEDYETIERILNYAYFTSKRLFIVISLLLYTGARISEILSIKLKNLDLKERYFLTEIKGKGRRFGIYFLPKFFIRYLREWIQYKKYDCPHTEFLFPSSDRGRDYIHPATIRNDLSTLKQELGIESAINPHAFRDFTNTVRFEDNINRKYRKLLLNQTPRDVNPHHYLKKYKKRKELQKLYDKTFPFPPFDPHTS